MAHTPIVGWIALAATAANWIWTLIREQRQR